GIRRWSVTGVQTCALPISADEVSSTDHAPADAVGLHPVLSHAVFPFVAKLSDFGLAKCTLGNEGSITATRETLGTPCYMAPELRSEERRVGKECRSRWWTD